MVEIAYDPVMAVVRMELDVRDFVSGPAVRPDRAGGGVRVRPLREGDPSMAAVAAVASSCGIRPAGFAAELASRPGRQGHAWLATVHDDEATASDVSSGGADSARCGAPRAAGVILLVTVTGRGGTSRVSIPWLLVGRHCRRVGVGRALVAAAMEGARTLGASRVSIDTLDRWPDAVAFWRSVGFRRV